MDISQQKKVLRESILNLRMNLTEAEVKDKSDKIFKQLKNLELMDESQNILLYMDFRNEVRTQGIIDYLVGQGKNIYLPRVIFKEREMRAYLYDGLETLEKSKYGILEPSIDAKALELSSLDLIIAPGLAFSSSGYRLGYGGGYYDKFLEKLGREVPVIALAFELQMLDDLPVERHDRIVSKIVTEKQVYESL